VLEEATAPPAARSPTTIQGVKQWEFVLEVAIEHRRMALGGSNRLSPKVRSKESEVGVSTERSRSAWKQVSGGARQRNAPRSAPSWRHAMSCVVCITCFERFTLQSSNHPSLLIRIEFTHVTFRTGYGTGFAALGERVVLPRSFIAHRRPHYPTIIGSIIGTLFHSSATIIGSIIGVLFHSSAPSSIHRLHLLSILSADAQSLST
jgi:hypothetical protein